MQIRRFTPEHHKQIHGQHTDLAGRAILRDARYFPAVEHEKPDQPSPDLPFLLEKPIGVISLHFEPHASMQEHSADHPILFLVISGHGKLRLGGPTGETESISTGDAILWPANLDHMVWTEDEALQGITIEMLNEDDPD